jgi:hypothetical protein
VSSLKAFKKKETPKRDSKVEFEVKEPLKRKNSLMSKIRGFFVGAVS